MQFILGSNSPRRREILGFFSLPFIQDSPDIDEESVPFDGDPGGYAMEIARRKAEQLAPKYPDGIILTADTIVFREGKLYLKPGSLKEAHAMLAELAGKEHQVYTGVCVRKKDAVFLEAERASVFFNELTDSQIVKYHSHFQPLDKAGGYASQRGGGLIVKRIEGCYTNIMGLPLQTVRRLLLKAGIDLWDYLKSI
jgi:septum formation protein